MINVVPVSGFSAPAVAIPASGLFVNQLPLQKNLTIFSPVPLIRGDKLNRAVPMNLVIPKHKLTHPVTRCLNVFKAGLGIARTIFTRSKKRLRIGVVVADARPAERLCDPQRFKLGIEGKAFLRGSIIRMQHQRLEDAPFSQDNLVNKAGLRCWSFPDQTPPSRRSYG